MVYRRGKYFYKLSLSSCHLSRVFTLRIMKVYPLLSEFFSMSHFTDQGGLYINSFTLCTSKHPLSLWEDPVVIKSTLQHPPPPPRANPGHLTIFCARGVGNLTFGHVKWGKLNRKCQVSKDFFSGTEVANSYKTCVWTCWKS